MQGPSPYLENLSLTIADYFQPERQAVLDSNHWFRVNFESYFFAEQSERDRFAENPLKYLTVITDPVTQQRFKPGSNPPFSVNEGVLFYFSAQSSKDVFDGSPDYYSLPNYQMHEEGEHSSDDGHNH